MVAAVLVTALVGLTAGVVLLGRDDPSSPSAPALSGEPIDYVALGDSYSAGPLIPLLRNDASGCFRSTNNYAAYVAGLLGVATYRDATCSGASTEDLRGRQAVMLSSKRPRPQLASLSPETDLVTIGIGGNDFGLFGSIAGECGAAVSRELGAPCRTRYADAAGRDTKARDARRIRGNVEAALADVRARAPEADVYVVGYPRLLPETGTCGAAGFTRADASWARWVAGLLNSSLRGAAEAVGATYVDLYPATRGHDICAGPDAWVNGRTIRFDRALSFHPFQEGMAGVARIVFETVTGQDAPEITGDAAPPADAVIRSR